ncbi:MAG: glycosyltransferase family 4 protein [Acidobacteria bacterium]|nr:glycosyltransferase family 4 protein [Acidobacteriota bacterium]
MKKKIAFVIQRYGEEVIGGSESLCRAVAERLTQSYEVEVLTTCALDYYDWSNHFPEGETTCNGVLVRRFPVEGRRKHQGLKKLRELLYAQPHSLEEERTWLNWQGPVSPRLHQYLEAERAGYASVIFLTYLYATTVDGIAIAPERAILVPTAHDEPPLRLAIYRTVFHLPKKIFYNTEAEKALVERVFHNQHVPSEVVGTGIDVPPVTRPSPPAERFFLYIGRIDAHKGITELADWFLGLPLPDVQLVVAGTPIIGLPSHPRIRLMAQVSEQEKISLLQRCLALIVPSLYESLSLAALEAWAQGRPVIGRRGSAVLEGHIRSSGAGLLFDDPVSLHEAVNQLCADFELGTRMGMRGRDYVGRNYSWDRVLRCYQTAIEEISKIKNFE